MSRRKENRFYREPDTSGRVWEFRAAEARPDGVRVDVTIAVPAGITWKDMRELAEVAQMTASRAMAQVIASSERPPF